MNVIVDLTDPAKQRTGLGDAFRVGAHIVTWSSDNVLKIPSSALFRSKDQWSVFIARDGRAVLVAVTPGHRNALEVEIVEGSVQTPKSCSTPVTAYSTAR